MRIPAATAKRPLGIVLLAAGAALLILSASAAGAPGFTPPTTYPSGSGAYQVVDADFNGDADPDLAVTNVGAGAVSILLGGPGGSFGPRTVVPVGMFPYGLAVGDFNGDADPDLAAANVYAATISILLGGPGGSFTGPVSFPAGATSPGSVAVGEFNGDSDPDLAVVGAEDNRVVSILLGEAGGTFSSPATYDVSSGSWSVAVGDFDGDSDPDLAVAASNAVAILLGGPGGTFTDATAFPVPSGLLSIGTGDFNGDSDPDLAVTTRSVGGVAVLLGEPGGSFSAATNFPSGGAILQSMEIADFNGDSDPDLASAWAGGNLVAIYEGAAGGSFTGPRMFFAGSNPQWVTAADFNGDSHLDLAAPINGHMSVLLGGFVPYPRPKAATKVHAALVPAHDACTTPNRAHGGGLSYGSCSSPNHLSPTLTVGVGDGSPAFSRSVGSVIVKAITGAAGAPDDADMAITFSLTNVMRKSDLSDYTGELGVDLSLQLTDREEAVSQTTVAFRLSATAPCTATASTIDGATCLLDTTAEALIPGAVTEGARAIFALDRITVRDGGADEDADTPDGDGTLATQGVFVP